MGGCAHVDVGKILSKKGTQWFSWIDTYVHVHVYLEWSGIEYILANIEMQDLNTQKN